MPASGHSVLPMRWRQHDVGAEVVREVAGVDAEHGVLRRHVAVVQPKIARDEVRSPVAVEVADGQAGPPPTHRRQLRGRGDVTQPRAIVVVEADRHPLADGDEVELPIAVEVDPGGVGDHAAGLHQLRGDRLGHVGEPSAVVAEDEAPGRERPLPRVEAPADEEIELAVAIEVAGAHDGGDGGGLRQRLRVADEAPAALIDVETVLQERRARRELIAAARHIEVGTTVSVGVEEEGAPVLLRLVRLPGLARGERRSVHPSAEGTAGPACRRHRRRRHRRSHRRSRRATARAGP